MMVPSKLLLRYFEIAQDRLLKNRGSSADDDGLVVGETTTAWSRGRIVEAQLASLDEAISEWQEVSDGGGGSSASIISRESVQGVLRGVGVGDYSDVSFSDEVMEYNIQPSSLAVSPSVGLRSRSSGQLKINDQGRTKQEGLNKKEQQKSLLSEAVERTNELARLAFSRSVLIAEWQRLEEESLDHQKPPQFRGDSHSSSDIDERILLEYCGLTMAAVRLPEVQQFLRDGSTTNLLPGQTSQDEVLLEGSAEDRLLRIQGLYWRALGREPDHAMDQLKRQSNNPGHILNTPKVLETLTEYASAMTVVATNAAIGNGDDPNSVNLNDDGTTRVVSVSYSEKIITGSDVIDASQAAPSSNTIDEHVSSQQKRELDTAKAASLLQQKLWDDFQTLSPDERSRTVERAKAAHHNFLEKVASTPPGRERVLLMQGMDGEVQRLLVIYKLWCSHDNNSAGE